MSRRWENKEVSGRGTKYCLVIDPEDGTHAIRTYGWSMEEVLDKVANTAETAQQMINRQRSAATSTATPSPTRSAVTSVPAPRSLTAEEQMQATTDLSNPAKSPQAVKTLLRGVGLDVDKMKQDEDIRRIAAMAQEWERQHPDFPGSDRNNRLLLDKASLMVGFQNITGAALDAAYQQLLSLGMIFEVESPPEPATDNNPLAASNGNSDNRVRQQRTATSYRSTSLRSDAGVTVNKPKYTRTEIDALTSKQLREKIEREPGFRDWYDREFSRAAF